MIYITRPVPETHKTVTKTEHKQLHNNLNRSKSDDRAILERSSSEIAYTQEDLERAVDDTNRVLFKDNGKFKFEVHEGTKRIMVKLVDKDTDEVIKEIPPEKILDLVASIWDLVGILVDERG